MTQFRPKMTNALALRYALIIVLSSLAFLANMAHAGGLLEAYAKQDCETTVGASVTSKFKIVANLRDIMSSNHLCILTSTSY